MRLVGLNELSPRCVVQLNCSRIIRQLLNPLIVKQGHSPSLLLPLPVSSCGFSPLILCFFAILCCLQNSKSFWLSLEFIRHSFENWQLEFSNVITLSELWHVVSALDLTTIGSSLWLPVPSNGLSVWTLNGSRESARSCLQPQNGSN